MLVFSSLSDIIPIFFTFFSLRNFKLHLDQIKDLDPDAESSVISMADAIAALHWHTKLDGMDIEFVIGSSVGIVGQPLMAAG